MAMFRGQFPVTIDLKGRFLLPGDLRKQLPEGAKRFVVTQGFEEYLLMYLVEDWDPIAENINEMDDMDPEVRVFKSMFLNPAEDVETDSAERAMISKTLYDYAFITKDMIIIASGDKWELWDKVTREKYVARNKPVMPAITGNISQKYDNPFKKKKKND
ncbi:MAG: division/cell wall cluster transcriptional repressor MraZ [Taibaiella sp.]|nr:division/cell wall cluster transcriptional repressor MraZ [Taibaiella sp.]